MVETHPSGGGVRSHHGQRVAGSSRAATSAAEAAVGKARTLGADGVDEVLAAEEKAERARRAVELQEATVTRLRESRRVAEDRANDRKVEAFRAERTRLVSDVEDAVRAVIATVQAVHDHDRSARSQTGGAYRVHSGDLPLAHCERLKSWLHFRTK